MCNVHHGGGRVFPSQAQKELRSQEKCQMFTKMDGCFPVLEIICSGVVCVAVWRRESEAAVLSASRQCVQACAGGRHRSEVVNPILSLPEVGQHGSLLMEWKGR